MGCACGTMLDVVKVERIASSPLVPLTWPTLDRHDDCRRDLKCFADRGPAIERGDALELARAVTATQRSDLGFIFAWRWDSSVRIDSDLEFINFV